MSPSHGCGSTGSADSSICHRPVAVGAAARDSRRSVHRPHPGARVGGDRGRVEGRVLDVVAHDSDHRFAHRDRVGERTAGPQPELAAIRRVELVPDVHELVGEADVELQSLEDRLDVGALESEEPLHPSGVDRARHHPLVDRELGCLVHASAAEDGRDRRPVLQVGGEHELASDGAEVGSRVRQEGRQGHGFSPSLVRTSSRFWTLPFSLRGSSVTRSNRTGTL